VERHSVGSAVVTLGHSVPCGLYATFGFAGCTMSGLSSPLAG